jgi:hypothetical protein
MTAQLSPKGCSVMANGQKRSNREIRKPKQKKASPNLESQFGNQVRAAATAKASFGKGKH